MGLEEVGLVGEGGASLVEGLFELFETVVGFVGDGLVGERPEALGGLQLG